MATKQRIPNPASPITSGVGAFDNLADAIANPNPSQPLRNAIGSAGRRYCDAIGSLPGTYGNILRSAQGVPSLLCKPYWDKNNFTPPTNVPPFTGGQCPVLYRVPIFRNPPGPGATGSSLANLLGPITSITATNIGNFQFRCTVVAANQTLNQVVNVLAGEPAPTLGPPIRQDNQPDNCGNLPGDLFPGQRPPPVPPGNPIFPPGQEPGVDPDGQPFFFVPPIPPVIPTLPTIDPPSIEPPPPPGGGSPPGPASPGAPGDGTDPEGEAPEGEEIYALVVEFLVVPQYAREIEPGLYVSPCRVFLGTEFGLDLDEAGRAMRSGQAVFAETDGLTNWRVSASVGFIVRVTPYYREKAS